MIMRDYYLDSCKAVLIFLVVLGHFLERMIGWKDPISHMFLGTIYFIHMPAFIFISGMLFKDKNWLKNILFFIALYLPFQFLFLIFDALRSSQLHLNWNVFERPYWILWYLWGMIFWTLLTHFLIKTKFAILIVVFFALCIGLSPWNNYQYSIGRIFTFFPFFIIGTLYGKIIIDKIQEFKFSNILVIFILIGIAMLVYLTQLNPFWLYGSLSYSQLKVSALDGTWLRLIYYIVSSLGVLAIFALVKHLSSNWLQVGKNTLPIYLLHGFVVILIAHYWTLNLNIYFEVLICIILSIFTCWILQQQIFDVSLRKISLWLIKPIEKLKKLLIRSLS